MSYNVGINMVEVDGKVAPSIQPAATSVAAIIIRSERGLPKAVRRITNWSQFTEHFGSYVDGAYGAYAVRGFFDNGGAVAYVTRVVNETHAKAASQAIHIGTTAVTVKAGYRGEEDPGKWGNALEVRVRENSEAAGTYDLDVRYKGQIVETWERLSGSADGAEQDPLATINDEFSGSKYIVLSSGAGAGSGESDDGPDGTDDPIAPDTSGFVALEDGTDDSLSGSALVNAISEALNRFDTYDVQLLCCPETSDNGWVSAALTYCENRGDCMFIGHTPENQDASAAKSYGKSKQGDKVYGALYFPWVRVRDPIGTQKWIPPTGHVMGVYARIERERGIWKAPAGNGASVNGVLDVRHGLTDADHTDLVKNGSVNAIRFIPGVGIVIDSSRTLSTNPLWLYVNVRLLFNFVKSSLKTGLRWVVQEPNDEALWNKVKYNSVTPFLMGLWRRGAFGPGSPDEVFTVKVDAENNPPESIQQGVLNVEVYFYPSRPAETIVITIGQQEGGASAAEG